MLIADAIRAARAMRDTELPDELFISWLSSHDGQVWENTVKSYENPGTKPVYDEETDTEATSLLIPDPYDDIYIDYLVMRIDLAHHDIDRYNNEAVVYASKRQDWANWYNRNQRWAATRQFDEIMPKFSTTQILF